MSHAHTPGPWFHDTRGFPHADVRAENGRNIACTWGVNTQPKTKEGAESQKKIARANARLIAAAPRLLAALEAIVEINPGLPMGMIEESEAAIAQALGTQGEKKA